MKKLAIFLLFYSSICFSDSFSESIDYYSKKGVPAKFVGIHDPGYVVIELDSGEVIDTTYSGIDFNTLYEWEKSVEKTKVKRDVKIIYTRADGVMVVDLKTNTKFKLDGALKLHPIDIAGDECESQHSSTMGIKNCKRIVLEAWDYELNRAYKALGGSDNSELKTAQLAWIEFRDHQIAYLQSEYGSRKGTIWGVVYMSHVVSLTKEQARRLQSIKEW